MRTMDCNVLVELVTAYLDGALDAESRASFEEYLLDCDGCGNYLEQFRVTIATVGINAPYSGGITATISGMAFASTDLTPTATVAHPRGGPSKPRAWPPICAPTPRPRLWSTISAAG